MELSEKGKKMADAKDKKEEIVKDEDQNVDNTDSPEKSKLVGWIITGVIALVCASGGYGVSGIFAKSSPAEITEEVSSAEQEGIDEQLWNDNENAKSWMFQLEPVVSNLNEPGVTRFLRMTVILEMSEKMDQTEGELFMNEKKIYLVDWLQTYLAGLSLDEVSGSSNQARIKVEIKENFNRILFPEARPLVTRVMLQGYAIQ